MYVDARRSDDGKNRVNIYNRTCVRAPLHTTCAIDQLDFISHLYKHISSRHILGLITYSSR